LSAIYIGGGGGGGGGPPDDAGAAGGGGAAGALPDGGGGGGGAFDAGGGGGGAGAFDAGGGGGGGTPLASLIAFVCRLLVSWNKFCVPVAFVTSPPFNTEKVFLILFTMVFIFDWIEPLKCDEIKIH